MNPGLIVQEYQETQRSSMKRKLAQNRAKKVKLMNLVKEILCVQWYSGWWHMVMDHRSESSIT